MSPDQEPRMKFPKLRMTVIKNEGFCYHKYNVGDEFIFDDFTHPPKHFCAGILQSAFPCLYALTFGARFPFMENMRSIETHCPDGGKMAFRIEVLDDEGKVVVEPRIEKPKGPRPKKMVIEVEENKGGCVYGYKVGDSFELQGLTTPAGFCGSAYSLLFPVLFALNFGASFPFEKNPSCKTQSTCPDGGKIKFKVTRVEEEQ